MSDSRPRRYIAHLTERCSESTGMTVFCTHGFLTDCGSWIETYREGIDKRRTDTVRHAVDRFWCETPELALAAQADRIRAIAVRMLQQAEELEEAAIRPALADAGCNATGATSRE